MKKDQNVIRFWVLCAFVCLFLFGCADPFVTVRTNHMGGIGELPLSYGHAEGYFEDEGIELTIEQFESGLQAAEKISEGKIDIGLMSSYAFVQGLMSGYDLQILSIYGTSYSGYYLLANVHSGIEHPRDLSGKTVGIIKHNQARIFFESLITYYRLDRSSLDLRLLSGDDWISKMADGALDAGLSVEPFVSKLLAMKAEEIHRVPLENFMRSNMVYAASSDYIQRNKRTVVRFLKAAHNINQDLQNPNQRIYDKLEKASGISQETLKAFLGVAEFRLVLDQLILITMESQFQWLKKQDYLGFTGTLSFLDHIYYDGLENVYPEGLTIIRE